MVKIIPTPDEEPEIPNPENSESQILNSRIKAIPTFPEVTEKIKEEYERLYTIDDLIDVWSRGMTNGATLWAYCQENNYNLPTAFEAGALELVNEVRSSNDKAHALQQVINNNMILLGVFQEKQ